MAGKAHPAQEKCNTILESLITDKSVAEICRKHSISPYTCQAWKGQFLTDARNEFDGKFKE